MIEETKCEVITVGTELLLGQIVDTNSSWLSEVLANSGINVYYKQTVGDNFDRLFSVFERAQKRSNIIFVTGGLGPTDDDLTREVAAQLFDTQLEIHQDTMNKIEGYFISRNKMMTENNRKQALGFQGGLVFDNEVGMAPALHYEHDGTWWFFLPGVPREMKWLVTEQILPFFKEKGILTKQLYSKVLSFQGIGESTLETELQDLIRNQTNPTIAPLAGNSYVTLRLTAKAATKEESETLIEPVEQQIMDRVGTYFTGYGHVPLEIQLLRLCQEKEITLCSCESVTGGLFASTIVQHEGASLALKGSIVSYTNEIKENVVGVPSSILDEFGAVSEPCARTMADQTREQFNTTIGISFTGIAGAEPVDGQEPGTVFIGISSKEETVVHKVVLSGGRNDIRERAVQEGLKYLLNFIKKFY
ncbi:competence/damage-inducible protein A [Piscibacillus halophilus]|uniref:competence/damage-inducible protein A n=1 Tax=Piscibacillus halophilus TaxID=571933 RepID=UPI00240A96B5|nr:competence/damage-inducible protein A [Piscibacillus halophilus]